MAQIILKKYQKRTLDILTQYLQEARLTGGKTAYDMIHRDVYKNDNAKPYQPLPIKSKEQVPYVCLRLPTGGGKTLLSAYTVKLVADNYLETDYPVVVLFVPTTTIQEQTIETFKDPKNANYQALDKQFNGRFSVYDVEDFEQIRPQDMKDRVCILVSTFAAFRVEDESIRKVYSHNENLEAHFVKIPTEDENGETKNYSLANLLAYHQPLMIIDEAHNANSDLSFDMIERINPSCIIEYTATPEDNSNRLVSVTASELKAENMLKLPIVLRDDHQTWQRAVSESIATRKTLQDFAVKDKDYIRPVVLFQTQNDGQEVTVDVILEELMKNNKIDRKHIAVVTSSQKELDDIDLLASDCPINYIITKQALKEGWDCSFAYVFCSVANTRSKTAIEQLLGRVLRMPYAEKRSQHELNQAYAHVTSSNWKNADAELYDRLVDMGWEEEEAHATIHTTSSLFGDDEEEQTDDFFSTTVSSDIDLSDIDQEKIIVEKQDNGDTTLKIKGDISDKSLKAITKQLNAGEKKAIKKSKERFDFKKKAKASPAEQGKSFSVPQLILNFDGDMQPATSEACLYHYGWNLLDYSAEFSTDEFSINQTTSGYIIDLKDRKLTVDRMTEKHQLNLKGFDGDWTESDLVRFLDRQVNQKDVKQTDMLEFLRKAVKTLLARSDIELNHLIQFKYLLAKTIKQKIEQHRVDATKDGFRTFLLSDNAIVDKKLEEFSFDFPRYSYPASSFYRGRYNLPKHYYATIADMNGEEADFAFALANTDEIEFWVRNLEKQPDHAFWLPTAKNKFYPDFVCKLTDGRIFVAEYKGEREVPEDTARKDDVGNVWAEKSGNVFLMARKEKDGLDIPAQIKKAIS